MLRRRSSRSNKVAPARQASIKNALAADEVIGNAVTRADEKNLVVTNPLFEDIVAVGEGGGGGGEDTQEKSWTRDIATVISAESRRSSAMRISLTDSELQQVLQKITPTTISKEAMFKRRVSASTAGAAVLGSSKELGIRPEKHEKMQKFVEHIKQQPRATYVPIECAEMILQQAVANAEESKTRHRNVVVALEATYREINDKTRRHYAELILRLQREIQTELRRLTRESKLQEELVETLRDTIASQTAAAAANEKEYFSQREQDRLTLDREKTRFNAIKLNMVEESRRILGTAVGEARHASEAAAQSRAEEARRRSMQRIELEEKALRATIALTLASIVSSVEKQAHNQGSENLHRGLAAAESEVDLLRTQLAEAMSTTQTLLAENTQLARECDRLREEAGRLVKAELEAMSTTQSLLAENTRLAKECDSLRDEAARLLRSELELQNGIRMLASRSEKVANDSPPEQGEAPVSIEDQAGVAPEKVAQKKGAEDENRAIEKGMEEDAAEQNFREAAEKDKAALVLSTQRAEELEAQMISLQQELNTAKEQAADALAAARRAEQQLLTPLSTTAPFVAEMMTPIPTTPTAATTGLVPNAAASGIATNATAAGVGVGLKIEKGPSSEVLRLEELKAELQTLTAAKKKVKGEIKGWLKDFEDKEGRPPDNKDKGAIKAMFVEHKRLETALEKLASDIQALEIDVTKSKGLPVEGGGEMTVPNTPATPTTPGFGGGTISGVGVTSSAALDAAAAKTALEILREENISLKEKLEESEKKKALLKMALGELNNTTTKMLAVVHPSATSSGPPSSFPDQVVTDALPEQATKQMAQQNLSTPHKKEVLAAEDVEIRERELEESLRVAQKEAHEATLAAKKSEHLRDEALLALEAARGELKACQLVVDEASEAARLREQVEALKVDLDAKSKAATAVWDAAAKAESEVEAAEARGLEAGIKRGRAEAERRVHALKEEQSMATTASHAAAAAAAAAVPDVTDAGRSSTPSPLFPANLGVNTETTVFGALAMGTTTAAAASAAAATASDTKAGVSRGGSDEAWVGDGGNSGGALSPAERKATDVRIAERELENLREREQDARGEAERMIDELQRASIKLEQQREREATLVSAIASLEKEKEALSQRMEMAQERADLALELVSAQREEAAKARQELALNAAKSRRASRDAGQAPAELPEALEMTLVQRTPRGRSQTAIAHRRAAEQLRLAAATLFNAIKEGTDLWKRDAREECYALYLKAGGRAASQMPPGQAVDDLRVALAAAKRLNPAKAAIALRKAFDTIIEAAMVAKGNLEAEQSAVNRPGNGPNSNRNSGTSPASGRGHAGRGGASKATSASGSVSPARNSSSGVVSVEKTAADTAENAAAIAAVFSASVSTANKDGDGGTEQDNSSSKVASLQRQLEALSARQKKVEGVALTVSGDRFSSDEDRHNQEEEKAKGGTSLLEVTMRRCTEMEDKIEYLEAECKALRGALDEVPAPGGTDDMGVEATRGSDGGGRGASPSRARADQLKISYLEQKNKEEAAKAKRLEAQVAKLEAAFSSGRTTASAESSAAEAKAAKAKMKAEIQQVDVKSKKLSADLEAANKGWESSKNEAAQLKKERDDLRQKVSSMGSMGEELQQLRTRAEDATRFESELTEATANISRVEGLYQVELALRKKYWNMMEDMKGKIRVYVRCRPFAKYEIDQDCKRAVRLVDESTVEVNSQHGPKQFIFDSVFSEDRGQVDIFEETRNLVQSALDGFNVCVFAYGQTGSGKTWTMTGGNGDQRGLTPRVIEEIFGNIEKSKGMLEVKVSCYFVELYLDNLRDLLFAMEHSTAETPPKLEIHMDSNKMVFVKNAVIKVAHGTNELMQLFTAGNHQRKVGGTKMNAESSRSHSVFSILLEVYNKTSKKTASGKLSLVDLAGSERADKTGATADRLKEAQSINKSLSALGDVIAALSRNEKFVPYRNNKLTQVMQDSLGGNAKTLMFVNISPADYNQDETVTALTYAARVKQVTNTAEKRQDGQEIARLKEIIRQLKSRENVSDDGNADVNEDDKEEADA